LKKGQEQRKEERLGGTAILSAVICNLNMEMGSRTRLIKLI
jgi:hypothetical protein